MKKILFIGCGNMGGAIASALIGHDLYFYSKSGESAKNLASILNATYIQNLDKEIIYSVDYIFLAMKPQQFDEFLIDNPHIINCNKIIISIMSALTIDFLTSKLQNNSIIRFMPNTPIVLKLGCSILLFAHQFSQTVKIELRNFFSQISVNIEVDSDIKLDQLTTLSGCGPAYIFEIASNLRDHFVNLGFNEDDITKMIKQTFLGSSMLMNNSQDSFSQLTDKVTSKGGMTIKALEVFRANNLSRVLSQGMQAAFNRSVEILKSMF